VPVIGTGGDNLTVFRSRRERTAAELVKQNRGSHVSRGSRLM